jgi:hypothetical protein
MHIDVLALGTVPYLIVLMASLPDISPWTKTLSFVEVDRNSLKKLILTNIIFVVCLRTSPQSFTGRPRGSGTVRLSMKDKYDKNIAGILLQNKNVRV